MGVTYYKISLNFLIHLSNKFDFLFPCHLGNKHDKIRPSDTDAVKLDCSGVCTHWEFPLSRNNLFNLLKMECCYPHKFTFDNLKFFKGLIKL